MALALFLGLVQFASASIFSYAAAPSSLVAHLSARRGAAIFSRIARVAPAPYVETMLAGNALRNGDLSGAEAYALKMPAGASKSELLGKIALAHGQGELAREYFLAAPDVDEMQAEIRAMSDTNADAAFAWELALKDRLQSLTTHPDAVAFAYWRMGQLITLRGYRDPPARATLWRKGFHYYTVAANLAPLSERYLLAAGSQAMLLREYDLARKYYQRGVDADPTSADAYAGLGIVAYRSQNVALARRYAEMARARDPKSVILAHLDLDLANAPQ